MASLGPLKIWLLITASGLALGQTGLSGQPLPERPGALRPVQLSKPRVEPLPETQWTATTSSGPCSSCRPAHGLATASGRS